MASSLTSHLQALSAEDLAALLERRTDSRRLLGQRRQDFGALAQILSEPHSIRWAVSSLNDFLAQLLELAVWLGPEVPAAVLAEQVPDASPEQLRAAAGELARWGLAFVNGGGPGGWALHLPGSTMAAVEPPIGFGPSARRLLDLKSTEFLTAVARNIGLASRPRSGKAALIDEITAVISGKAAVQRLLEGAPPKAADLFERIRQRGGTLGRHDLMLTGIIRWSDPPWSERRQVFTPLDWLEAHGVAVFDGAAPYAGSVTIPGEVELALRGGALFARWPSPTPPALSSGAVDPAGRGDVGDPSKIVAEMEVLLESWAETRPPTLQKGGLGVRELRKTAKALHFTEHYVSFLYALAAEAQLIAVNLNDRVVPTAKRAEWTASPAPARWAVLFEAWLNAVLWTEERADPLLAPNDAAPRLWASKARRGILEELSRLAPGEATSVHQLAAVMSWRYPQLLGSIDNASVIVERALAGLELLGTISGPPAIRLLEPGRSAIADAAWFDHVGPATAAFPTEVATCTVGADLRVIVPGPPVPELATALGRFADLKASSPARIYELTEASLRRGLDGGMTAEEMTALLSDHATRGVPQNVAYLIEDVGRRYGHLIAGQAGLYLRADDPALLRSAVSDRRLASFRPRLIAPTVAVLEGTSTEALLAQLRLAG
ncbi:MAG TPA: helicase-associated domain-containing protein, partial [Acidimicrobiia bacterium]|nr:helicase-associated domain-containing protein [Acidimicrobiia bacterium]